MIKEKITRKEKNQELKNNKKRITDLINEGFSYRIIIVKLGLNCSVTMLMNTCRKWGIKSKCKLQGNPKGIPDSWFINSNWDFLE
jgi:hypothetical protein